MRLRPASRVVAVVAVLAAVAPPSSPLAAQAAPARVRADYAAAMLREHAHDAPVASPAATAAPRAQVTTSVVTYGTVGGRELKGVLARPAGAPARGPALIVIHEWWGLNDNIRSVAQRYAGEGYTVLAVDLFGRTATTPDSAMVLYRTAMQDVPAGERNLAAAIAWLKQRGATRIGTVGYCFGGHWSLRTGLVGGADVQAVVMYYGAPITAPAELARLRAPVLGLFGGADRGIPVDSVRAMERALGAAGRAVTITVYDGAGHAFANPSGRAYDAAVADDAWGRALAFFAATLK